MDIKNNKTKFAVPVLKLSTISIMACLASAPTLAQNNEGEMEEVITVGIAQSLKNAANIKENASGVVDAISAEELGKFPDSNVAESLQRITGVAIARTRGGEGRFVTIRGLGQEFNGVSYNGRTIATENNGREFSFDSVASELIAEAKVYKTSEARLGDGSIGGAVEIVSAKPLDQDGTGAWSLTGKYDTLSEEFGQKFSGVYSSTFNDETMGFLASFVYDKSEFRVDTAESIDTFTADFDQFGRFYTGAPGQMLTNEGARWTSFAYGTANEERERTGASLVFQYQPSEELDITTDFLYTALESPGNALYQTNYTCGGCVSDFTATNIDSNNIVLGYTARSGSEFLARNQAADVDTLQFGINADWQATDRFTLETDLAYSKSEGVRDNIGLDNGSGSFYVAGLQGGQGFVTYQSTGKGVPNFDIDVVSSAGNRVNLEDAELNLLGGHFTRESTFDVEDEVTTLNLDGTYDLSSTTSLLFGGDFTTREKTNILRDNSDGGKWCRYFCGYGRALRGLDPEIFDAAIASGAITTSAGFPVDDLLSDTGATLPRRFLTFTPQVLRDLYNSVQAGEPILDANGNPTGAVEDFSGQGGTIASGADILRADINQQVSNTLKEDIIGAYVQYNWESEFAGVPWSGNVGVRVAKTEIESIGAQQPITDIIRTGPADQAIILGDATPVVIKNSYTDVLPSLNMQFDLKEGLILRTALSETIARPSLTDLSTFENVSSTNIGVEGIISGNPKLDPTRSKNFDVSLEWYADNSSAAVAFFHKDISDFVLQAVSREPRFDGRPFDITQPQNGQDAEITGLELAYQTIYESGFGFQVNATFTDNEAEFNGQKLPFANVSDESFNVSAFYEGERFTVRLAVNNRGEYARTISGRQGLVEYVDDYTQLDLSSSYDINDSLTLFVEGINLTGEDETVFYGEGADRKYENFLRYYEDREPRINFGIRGTF